MHKLSITVHGQTFTASVSRVGQDGSVYEVEIEGKKITVSVPDPARPYEALEWLVVDGKPYELVFDPDLRWVETHKGLYEADVRDLSAGVARPQSGDGRVKAPIPGLVKQVFVRPDEQVEVGQPVAVLEAMKMANEIRAPRSGKVSAILVQIGQIVVRQQVLIEIV